MFVNLVIYQESTHIHSLCRTHLDEGSASLRDFHLITRTTGINIMPPAEFEPAFPACERPQNHVFDRAATGIARIFEIKLKGNEFLIVKKRRFRENAQNDLTYYRTAR